jgi:hypothetical protein
MGEKMKARDFIASFLISLFFGFSVMSIFIRKKDDIVIRKYQTREEIQKEVKYLKDSFETINIKKQLDSFYPFGHSKIPQ